jgi:hypothetical protein
LIKNLKEYHTGLIYLSISRSAAGPRRRETVPLTLRQSLQQHSRGRSELQDTHDARAVLALKSL